MPRYPTVVPAPVTTENNQQLFTDPKLLAMLRSDVEAISMKRSKNMASTFQTSTTIQSSSIHSCNIEKTNNTIPGVVNIKTSIIDKK